MVARNRLVISGQFGTAAAIEEWQIGLHFAGSDGAIVEGLPALQAWATAAAAILDAGETDYSTLTTALGGECKATRVDVYQYNASGPAVATAGANFTWQGSGSVRNPLSTAMVMTLQTAFAGASYRGRCYFPATGVTITSGGKLNVNPGHASEFAELVDDMRDAATVSTLQPVVYSPTRNLVTPVTSVRLGDVPDHQRRRSEGLVEAFLTAPIP